MCTNIAMCLGACACQACGDCINSSFKQQVRLAYFIFDMVFVALGILLLYGLSYLLSEIGFIQDLLTNFIHCPADQGTTCLGLSSIFRLSLALVIMHIMILFMLFFRNGCSKVFNEEVWLFKILIVVVLFVAFFFVSNDFFEGYSSVAMVLSIFFLVFQVVMIIDICYLWGVSWVKNYDEGNNCWAYLMIFFTLLLYGGTLFFIIDGFSVFGGCGIGTFVNIVSVIFMVLGIILVLLKLNPDGSLLTSSAVTLVASYLTWSGLTDMNETCNTWQGESAAVAVNLCIGLVFIIAALLYVSIGNSDQTSGQVKITQAVLEEPKGEEDEKRKKLDEEENLGGANKEEKEKLSLDAYQSNSYIYYHIIMILACCYVSMLLTNWGQPVVGGNSYFNFQASTLSMWIKIGTSWVTMAVYLWTVIAPTVCPSRDFS